MKSNVFREVFSSDGFGFFGLFQTLQVSSNRGYFRPPENGVNAQPSSTNVENRRMHRIDPLAYLTDAIPQFVHVKRKPAPAK